jgi:TolB-like protein
MSDVTPSVPEASVPSPGAESETREKKKKDKFRSAWIGFVGRIVAQLVGAGATVFLALYFVDRATDPSRQAQPDVAAADSPAVERVSLRRHSSEKSLAVLPMQNFSADSRHDYFADGLTEALIANLAQVDGLRVTSRTSSMHYKGQRKPLPQIARELDVHMIIEGSTVTQGNRLRVTAQLIEADTDEHLWAKTYDRPLRDILTVQADIAAAVARDVQLVLASSGTRLPPSRKAPADHRSLGEGGQPGPAATTGSRPATQ